MSKIGELIGVTLGPTRWLEVTQERIDGFAAATDDPQWIHVDIERAAAESPFGTTIAHGFLTLSLCVPLLHDVLPPSGRVALNYGVNRVRFPAPVPSGSRIRATFEVVSVEVVESGGEQAVLRATVEADGVEKPVCVAELVTRLLPADRESVERILDREDP
jgi:acyl dehydratase